MATARSLCRVFRCLWSKKEMKMQAILGVILALFGVGALAAGGRESGESSPADPAGEPTPPIEEEDDVPAEEDLLAEEEDIPPDEPEEIPAVETGDPPSGAPELPDSAYALGWEGLSAQEQYMLELVNRARLDPEAEEDRTGDLVDSGVSTAPKQALAVDPILSAAAENHSEDMLARDFFDHRNPDGDTPTDRAIDEGWTGGGVWENISARWSSASSVSDEQGWVDVSHEGLWESDGHQYGMLQTSHTVVGIGIDWGEWSYPETTYPTAMLVTEKFANDGETYLTGVVIDDADNDDFYDIGEGQGGVRITVWNDDETLATSTWESGGYSIALDAGTYNVLFEGGDLDTAFETVVTIGDQNVKLDVNEDDLGMAVSASLAEDPTAEDEDPIAALFLSAEASLEVIEREARLADAHADSEPDDLLAMF